MAVRSSACAEDSEAASYAGQQETYLGVQGSDEVLSRIRDCWASFFTERALFYRGQKGSLDDVGMAVVVQRMVAADVAGVLFTCDPVRRRRDRMVVEAVFGLGETAVSGRVTPDHYVLTRAGEVKKRHVAVQPVALVSGEHGGTAERELNQEEGAAATLDEEQLRTLARLGDDLEEARCAPGHRVGARGRGALRTTGAAGDRMTPLLERAGPGSSRSTSPAPPGTHPRLGGRAGPEASEALQLAALTHDIERAFPDPEQRWDSAVSWDDPAYNRWHQDRCAEMVAAGSASRGRPRVPGRGEAAGGRARGGRLAGEADLPGGGFALPFGDDGRCGGGVGPVGPRPRERAAGKLRNSVERIAPDLQHPGRGRAAARRGPAAADRHAHARRGPGRHGSSARAGSSRWPGTASPACPLRTRRSRCWPTARHRACGPRPSPGGRATRPGSAT